MTSQKSGGEAKLLCIVQEIRGKNRAEKAFKFLTNYCVVSKTYIVRELYLS